MALHLLLARNEVRFVYGEEEGVYCSSREGERAPNHFRNLDF